MHKNLQRYIKYPFRAAVLLYTVVAIFYFLKRPAGLGDELLFINDLSFIKSEGWLAAIEKGISIPYMILVYPFSQIMDAHIALRAVNVLLFILLLGYFFKLKKLKNLDFYYLLLFFFSTVGYFLFGTNDPLFFIGLILFFTETYFILSKARKANQLLLWLGLILALYTRVLFFVFLPVILLSLFLFLRNTKIERKPLGFAFIFFALMLVLNIPSLVKNKTLSYDAKLPPSHISATWGQRQYYAQLLVNDGKLENYNHPSWKQTQEYLDINGEESLPKGLLEGMMVDPALTVKEFLKDFLYICIYSTRQLGLILPMILFFGFRSLIKEKKITAKSYIPIIMFGMTCIFALIIISFVELRWLTPLFIVSMLYYSLLIEKKQIPLLLVTLNYGILALMSIYGAYSLILKL